MFLPATIKFHSFFFFAQDFVLIIWRETTWHSSAPFSCAHWRLKSNASGGNLKVVRLYCWGQKWWCWWGGGRGGVGCKCCEALWLVMKQIVADKSGAKGGGVQIDVTSAASESVIAFYIFICLKGVTLKGQFTGNFTCLLLTALWTQEASVS